jgi:hypothetical protein
VPQLREAGMAQVFPHHTPVAAMRAKMLRASSALGLPASSPGCTMPLPGWRVVLAQPEPPRTPWPDTIRAFCLALSCGV